MYVDFPQIAISVVVAVKGRSLWKYITEGGVRRDEEGSAGFATEEEGTEYERFCGWHMR